MLLDESLQLTLLRAGDGGTQPERAPAQGHLKYRREEGKERRRKGEEGRRDVLSFSAVCGGHGSVGGCWRVCRWWRCAAAFRAQYQFL